MVKKVDGESGKMSPNSVDEANIKTNNNNNIITKEIDVTYQPQQRRRVSQRVEINNTSTFGRFGINTF